ncbi:PAS domain S-box protein [Flavobacterium sp.]|uniref:PAS domain S-box protein n=1 Tax=Flavobacterium sp. TaxID=239 RepID=UPI003D6C4DE0
MFKKYFFLLLTAVSFQVSAQVYDFQCINQDDGLPSSSINAVFQDSRNYLWIGTEGGGLVKYDGIDYEVFDRNKGLSGEFITDITEDANTNIIIGTRYGGIHVYDGQFFSRRFSRNTKALTDDLVYKVLKTDEGIVVVAKNEVIKIDSKYQSTIIVRFGENQDPVNSIIELGPKKYLLGTSNGLLLIDQSKLSSFYADKISGKTTVCKDHENKIYIGTDKGQMFTLEENKLSGPSFIVSRLGKPYAIKNIFLGRSGNIWFSSYDDQGICMNARSYFSYFDKSNGFAGENVNGFYQDSNRNLYVTTDGTGLFKSGAQQFIAYSNVEYLNRSDIFSVLMHKNNIYVSSRQKEVVQLSFDHENPIRLIQKFPIKRAAASIVNKDGKVVFGSDKGLTVINGNSLTNINLQALISNREFNIKSLYQDSQGRYFIGTFGNGLFIVDKNFKFIQGFNKDDLPFFSNYISVILPIAPNKWYLGTNMGLFLLKEEKNKFFLSKKIIGTNIELGTQDSFGNYWFAGDRRLNVIVNHKTRRNYTEKSGLLSTLFYTLIANEEGDLLIGSNLGVAKAKVTAEGKILNIINYNSKNGFSGLETNMRAQFKDDEGNIYFATIKGIYQSIPHYRIEEKVVPKIQIISINLFNESNSWNKEGSNHWINLPPENYVFKNNENHLVFNYLTINNKITKNALYSYKLEGIENATWSRPTAQREINYSNLSFGKYTFKVRVVNNLGIPISNEAEYSFSIEKPFYLYWWFILTALGIIATILTIIFNKISKYNKDFVKNYSENESTNEQFGLYFLFLGITIPLIDFIIEITNVRETDTLKFNLITGLVLILVYLLSKKYKFVNNNLKFFFSLFLFVYTIETVRKMVSYQESIASYFDFLIIFFLAYSIFKSIRAYWFFVFMTFGLVIILYTTNGISREIMVAYLYCIFIIAILNHIRYIVNLNATDKFLFADNIINKGTSLVLAVNKKGEIIYCSETIDQILGYTQEEVKGYNYWNLTEDSEFSPKKYDINQGLYIRKLKCKNGSFKFIQWKDSRYSDDLFVGIGQDVTEQIEVQNQYKKLIESASDMIYEADLKGKFTYINNFTVKLLGYSKAETIGKHFTAYIKKEYIDEVIDFYRNVPLDAEDIPYIEFPISKKDGQELWVSQKVTLSRNTDGKVIGYAAIARDITILKNIEIEHNLRQAKNEAYNKTINQLVTKRYTHADSFDKIVNQILKSAAEGSNINRISFWNYSEDKIHCVSMYKLDDGEFTNNITIYKSERPIYFEGLENDRIIIASNVYENYYTQEFTSDYFPKNDIKSMLDVPIIVNGEMVSILCFETIRNVKNWDNDDINFARSVSDVISLTIESQKRLETERHLAFKTEILSAIATSTKKLLKSNNIQELFSDVFSIIGKATKIDRIYYFENNPVTKTLSQKNEWVNDHITPQIDNQELQNMTYEACDVFLEQLLENKFFKAQIDDIKNPIIKKRWVDQDILSILIFPIFVKNQFYGSIGFDDCTEGRNWTEDEVGVLKILANNIASAIERLENETLLQESEQRFKLLANNIPGTVFLSEYDDKWTKVYLNDEIEKLTGYKKSEFLDKKVSLIDLVHPLDKDNLINYTNAAINKKEAYHVVYRLLRKDDVYIWVEEFGDAIIKEGKVAYIEGILVDITQKKAIDSEIKARELAEASSKAKSEFLANMSHEIRTPLNAIIGFSNLLKETKLEENQAEYISTVNQSASILLEVVNDILDFSKIETGKFDLDYQKTNLYELANQVVDIIRFDSEQRHLSLNLFIDENVPKYVSIDALRIKQILLNLLSNAVKFTNKGKVELHIELESQTNTRAKLKIAVIDTGIGIKKENQKKIFEPFSQEDNSTTRKYGGTGLGLAISSNILKLMKSRLELNSDIRKGSTFYFTLDLVYFKVDEVLSAVDVNQIDVDFVDLSLYCKENELLLKAKKILVIEDNKINMLLAKTLIKKILPNAVVYEAKDGKVGVEQCKMTNPDIILLDIQMPILNGYETAQEIRKFNPTIPIIALTAGTIKGEREKCIESGMNDYISKPIIKDLFENVLLKWLQ